MIISGNTIYGMTQGGGSVNEYGTIFKMDAAGTLTRLHSFASTEGFNPQAPLIQAGAYTGR